MRFQLASWVGLSLHLVVQLLQPQHRLHPRHQGKLVERLGEIFVGAGLEPGHHILGVGLGGHQDDRHERQRRIALQPAADFDAVELGHHHVEQEKVRQMFAGGGQRFLAVGGLQQLVAVHAEARRQNVPIGLVIVYDQDARWIVHNNASRRRYGKYSRIFASN